MVGADYTTLGATMNRRNFLKSAFAMLGAGLLAGSIAQANEPETPVLTRIYPLGVFEGDATLRIPDHTHEIPPYPSQVFDLSDEVFQLRDLYGCHTHSIAWLDLPEIV